MVIFHKMHYFDLIYGFLTTVKRREQNDAVSYTIKSSVTLHTIPPLESPVLTETTVNRREQNEAVSYTIKKRRRKLRLNFIKLKNYS